MQNADANVEFIIRERESVWEETVKINLENSTVAICQSN